MVLDNSPKGSVKLARKLSSLATKSKNTSKASIFATLFSSGERLVERACIP